MCQALRQQQARKTRFQEMPRREHSGIQLCLFGIDNQLEQFFQV